MLLPRCIFSKATTGVLKELLAVFVLKKHKWSKMW
jgi:hypothetical protein